MVLVPTSRKLIDVNNGWIPDRLDRFLPTIDIEGEAGLPEPEMEIDMTSEHDHVGASV